MNIKADLNTDLIDINYMPHSTKEFAGSQIQPQVTHIQNFACNVKIKHKPGTLYFFLWIIIFFINKLYLKLGDYSPKEMIV